MKKGFLLLFGLGLSLQLAYAQNTGNAWEKELENEICDCLSEKMGDKETADEQQLKTLMMSCFLKAGPKYESQMMATAKKEGVSNNDIGRRIGESIAQNCPVLLKSVEKLKESKADAGMQVEEIEQLIANEEFAEAERQLSKLLLVYGTDGSLFNLRGISRDGQNKFWAAVADHHRAMELDESNAVYPYNLGRLLADNQLHADALPYLKHSLSLNDQDTDTWMYLGFAHYNLEQYDSAQHYLSQLLKLDAKNTKAMNLLGLTLQEQEENEEAVRYFTKATKQEPAYSTPYFNLAQLYYELEETEKAKAVLAKYKEYDADILRLQASYARDEEDYQQALKYYQQVQQKGEASGSDLYYMAFSYQQLNNHTMAATLYDQTLELRPEDSDVYFGLAKALMQLENYERAGKMLETLIELEPGDAYNYDLRAEYYEVIGKPAKALADLQKSAEIYANDPQVYMNQGRVLLSMKKPEEACAAFQQAAALDSELAAEALEANCAQLGTN